MNELGNQLASGMIVSYFLEILKNSNKFHFLNQEDSGKYKKLIGALAALVTTVGIHYAFDYNETGNGVLTIVLPTAPEFLHAIVDFGKQWAFQQFAYDVAVKDK